MSWFEVGLRLMLSMFFGGLIGIERQWHHKNAGLKTNTLVAVGATAFGLISQYGFGSGESFPHVAAGVVTGIGFIGGGVIMRRGGSVQGINSAATLWASASLGLATGVGFYGLAWLLLAVVLIIQFALRWAANLIDRYSGLVVPHITYCLEVQAQAPAMAAVYGRWQAFSSEPGVMVISYRDAQNAGAGRIVEATFGLSENRALHLSLLAQELAAVEGVDSVRWTQSTVEERD